MAHFTFTKNNIPLHEVQLEGKKVFLSPENVLQGAYRPFNLKHLVAFGTQVTFYIPPERRKEQKTPGQKKAADGVILGYTEDSRCYRVWDIDNRKIRDISFNFCVISEGFFPFRSRRVRVSEKKEEEPLSFFPTLQTLLEEKEWKKFDFSEEEERIVLEKNGILSLEVREMHRKEEKEEIKREKQREPNTQSAVSEQTKQNKTTKPQISEHIEHTAPFPCPSPFFTTGRGVWRGGISRRR
jgi:hypothetical protein